MGMAHRWGIQVPNGPYSPDEIVDIYGDGCIKVMQAELSGVPRMKERAPNALFFLRMYLPDWYATNPEEWARECAVVWKQNRHQLHLLTWANEQNLADESSGKIGASSSRPVQPGDYEKIRDWNIRWLQEWGKLDCKDAILVFPGLAYGHSDDQDDGIGVGIGLQILRPVIEKCHLGNIHLYVKAGKPVMDEWEGLGRLAKQRPWFLGKQIVIGETGHFEAWTEHSPVKLREIGYELQSHPDILCWNYFIHADPTRAHQANDMSRNNKNYDAIRDAVKLQRPEIKLMVPTPIPVEPSSMDIVPSVKTVTKLTNNHSSRRAVTRGVVIHSTRSGRDYTLAQEYSATVNFFLNPTAEASAHFVVGPSEVTRQVHDDDKAWHAAINNNTHLGIEIAQPIPSTPYTDFQYKAVADIVKQWAAKYGFPLKRVMSQSLSGIIGHEDTEQGRSAGKSDPGPKFDWSRFMTMVTGQVSPIQPTPQEVEANALAPAFKAAEYLFKVGTPKAIRAGHAIQSAIDAYKFTP